MQKTLKIITPWVMWLLAMCFFIFQFIIRLTPGVMMEELMQNFMMDAAIFGIFSGIYYLGYAGFQVPVGILFDKFKSNIIIAISASVCVFGNAILLFSDNMYLAIFARFLMGVGSVAGFLGAAKMIRYWFDQAHYTKMMGLTYSIGFLGSVYGGKPTRLLVEELGWQNLLYTWIVVGCVLIFCSMIFIRDKARIKEDTDLSFIPALKIIFTNKKLLTLGLSGGLLLGLMEGFADIWGISYFHNIYKLSISDSALASSMIYVGICIGGILIPYLAELIGNRRRTVITCCFMIGGLFIFLLSNDSLPYSLLLACNCVMGIFLCYQVLMFAIAIEMVPKDVSTLAAGTINMLNMGFGFIFHTIIGAIVKSLSKNNDITQLTHADFILALSPILIGILMGTLIFSKLNIKK
jgi:MFS family permease